VSRPIRPRCDAMTKAGLPCKGWAVQGSTMCGSHDSAHAEHRLKRTTRSGPARRTRSHMAMDRALEGAVVPGRLDVAPALIRAAIGVWKREIAAQQGTAIAALLGQAVRSWQATELEDRIAALERLQPADVVISEVPVWTGPSELVVVDEVPSAGPAEDEESDVTA
jgi:hypothetical protein